jgi:hypothetical protein
MTPLAAYRSARAIYRRFRRRSVFAKIYRENLWGDPESRSGPGSGLARTDKFRAGLLDAIQRLDVHTMVDAPCGDYAWLSALDLAQHLTWYRGLDIVPQMIRRNRELWGSERILFEDADLARRAPPQADLILCRHLLIHLPFADCLRVLRNFKSSHSRYLMITNQPQVLRNEEILFTGSFRPLNLHLPPFDLPQPICSIDDSRDADDGAVSAVFELSTLGV